MARITGIGGVFFKSKGDSAALAAWYRKHLGLTVWHVADGNKVELWQPMAWNENNKGS